MFQKNTFKLVFFDGVARTFPTHKDMGVGRGAGIWKLQQMNTAFLILRGQAPPEIKVGGLGPYGPPGSATYGLMLNMKFQNCRI